MPFCYECKCSVTDIIAHRVEHHNLDFDQFVCSKCLFQTFSLEEFKNHQNTNHKESSADKPKAVVVQVQLPKIDAFDSQLEIEDFMEEESVDERIEVPIRLKKQRGEKQI